MLRAFRAVRSKAFGWMGGVESFFAWRLFIMVHRFASTPFLQWLLALSRCERRRVFYTVQLSLRKRQ